MTASSSTESPQASTPLPEPPLPRRWGLGAIGVGIVALIMSNIAVLAPLMLFAVIVGTAGADGTLGLPAPVLLLAGGVASWLAFGGVPWLYSHFRGTKSLRRDFGFEFKWADIPRGAGIALIALVAGGAVSALFGFVTGSEGVSNTDSVVNDTSMIGVSVTFLVAVIGAPLFEELFFRGFVLRTLQGRYSNAVAIVASSVLFGLLHTGGLSVGHLIVPLITGLYGVVLAVTALRFGRLGPSIWAHVFINATAVVATLLT